MPSNIFLFIEYVLPTSQITPIWGQNDEPAVPTSASHIMSLTEKSFLIGTDYDAFAMLAGVRSAAPSKYSPRGIPSVLSYKVSASYFCPIIADDDIRPRPGIVCERRSDAESYVKKGISHYGRDRPGARNLISNPEWTNPSWLMTHEVELALTATPLESKRFSEASGAVFAAMRSLESQLGQGRTRLVFWFDKD